MGAKTLVSKTQAVHRTQYYFKFCFNISTNTHKVHNPGKSTEWEMQLLCTSLHTVKLSMEQIICQSLIFTPNVYTQMLRLL